ncbi:hypothetical protein [Methylobacterium sp. J-070]|uniref:hypothetical protein n=1 Tax=Methylobacterium sp. J-070 TaxID=2836650 RepID=UPI001FBA9102|nr:hypothetical protein [Methylobacterium sp. J-070]MCJ2054209.1 hypothetical protein [Methylobacterium sp. J-070]
MDCPPKTLGEARVGPIAERETAATDDLLSPGGPSHADLELDVPTTVQAVDGLRPGAALDAIWMRRGWV